MSQDLIILRLLKHKNGNGHSVYVANTGLTAENLHTHMLYVTTNGIENPDNKHLLLIKNTYDVNGPTGFESAVRMGLWPIVFPDGSVGTCNANALHRDTTRTPLHLAFTVQRLARNQKAIEEWTEDMNAYLDNL